MSETNEPELFECMSAPHDSTLLSCPFCMGTARFDPRTQAVYCLKCGGHSSSHQFLSSLEKQKQAAIEAWNRRTPAAPQWMADVLTFLEAFVRCDCIHFFGEECNSNNQWRGQCPFAEKNQPICTKCSYTAAEVLLQEIKTSMDVPPQPEGKESTS